MTNKYMFKCASKREEGVFYRVEVSETAWVCECSGVAGNWCSHIEATLVAGERAMVPSKDWQVADKAMALLAGKLAAPRGWKASWRRNMRWRGLSSGRTYTPSTVGQSGLPVVCFTGPMPRPRKVLMEEALGSGWEATDTPHSKISVLVAADPNGSSRKLAFARSKGIPILDPEEWQVLITAGDGVLPEHV